MAKKAEIPAVEIHHPGWEHTLSVSQMVDPKTWTEHTLWRYGMTPSAGLMLSGGGAVKTRVLVRNLAPAAMVDEHEDGHHPQWTNGQAWAKAWNARGAHTVSDPKTWVAADTINRMLSTFGLTGMLRSDTAQILYGWRATPVVAQMLTWLCGPVTRASWTQFGWNPFEWLLGLDLKWSTNEVGVLTKASIANEAWVKSSTTLKTMVAECGFGTNLTPMDVVIDGEGALWLPNAPGVTPAKMPTFPPGPKAVEFIPTHTTTANKGPLGLSAVLTSPQWIRMALVRSGTSSGMAWPAFTKKWLEGVDGTVNLATKQALEVITSILRVEGQTKTASLIKKMPYGYCVGCTGSDVCEVSDLNHKVLLDKGNEFAHKGWRIVGQWAAGGMTTWQESFAGRVNSHTNAKPGAQDFEVVLAAYSKFAATAPNYQEQVRDFHLTTPIKVLDKVTSFHYNQNCSPDLLPGTLDLIEEIGKATGLWPQGWSGHNEDEPYEKIVAKKPFATGGLIMNASGNPIGVSTGTIHLSGGTVFTSPIVATKDEVVVNGPDWKFRLYVNSVGQLDIEFTGTADRLTQRAELLLSTVSAQLQAAVKAAQPKQAPEVTTAEIEPEKPHTHNHKQKVTFSHQTLMTMGYWPIGGSSNIPPANVLLAYAIEHFDIPAHAKTMTVYKVKDPLSVLATYQWEEAEETSPAIGVSPTASGEGVAASAPMKAPVKKKQPPQTMSEYLDVVNGYGQKVKKTEKFASIEDEGEPW